jgi:hypothetical protein
MRLHVRMAGEFRVGDHRADAHAAVVENVDAIEAEPANVDELRRTHHVEFHQIEQHGAAREEHGIGALRV